MSDGSGSIPAAWFPDPDGGPRQRYWDGTAWTEHYHPPKTEQFAPPVAGTALGAAPAANAAPVAGATYAAPVAGATYAAPTAGAQYIAPPPKKKRTALILSIIAGALVLVIGIPTFVLVGLPAIEASHGFTGAVVLDESDQDYAYTEEMIDIERDKEFEYPAEFDYEAASESHPALDEELAESGSLDRAWAFEVFIDPAFTKTANATVLQYNPGEPIVIMPGIIVGAYPADGEPVNIHDEEFNGWGLHDEYYLMRKIDSAGNILDKPVVTRFTAKSELEAPAVTFSSPKGDGNLTIEWNAVEGADNYYVIASNVNFQGSSRDYKLLGQTSDLTWSSDAVAEKLDVAPFLLTQNSEMRLYDYASSDTVELGWSTAGDSSGYDYGVIATNGTNFSSYKTYDATEVSAALPYEVAFGASRKLKKWGKSGYIDGIENLQKTLAFTSLDGATRSTVAYIDPAETVTKYKDRWVVAVRGRGTGLGEWVPISRKSEPNIEKAVAKFNSLAEASAPTTGMPTFDLVSAPVDEFGEPVKEAPATEYPVYGSNDFTKFLAQHFIGHTQVIDVSDYLGKPGMPDIWDAAMEARYQNPYAISISGWSLSGTQLGISYTFNKEETEGIQKEIYDKVNSVVGSVVNDSMSDKEKVTALNNWIVKNGEYDYDALAASDAGGILPDEYAHAWTAKGILVDGIGVCASYAYAFNALANAAGVRTIVVTGDVQDGGAHAWNKVRIGTNWRSVDPTWNDSPGGNRFLMITDKDFTGSATRSETKEWMIDLDIKKYATK